LNNTAPLGPNDTRGTFMWATTLSVKVTHQETINENHDAENLLRDIGNYYAVMRHLIIEHGGIVQKFDGEQLVALFPDELPKPAHADRSVSAAVAVMEQLNELNHQRKSAGLAPFRLGIGVNTGQVLLGKVPVGPFPVQTVIGDGVSAATFLGSLNTQTPFHNVFISDSTLSSLQNLSEYLVDNLGEVYLANTAKPLRVYALSHHP